MKRKYYYLDPHYVQDADKGGSIDLEQYKPNNLYEFEYEDMQTSLLVAFYIRDQVDFLDFHTRVTALVSGLGEEYVPFNFGLPDEGGDLDQIKEF